MKKPVLILAASLICLSSGFSQMIGNLTNGLIAYYPLHTDTLDYSGYGNDLTLVGSNSSFNSGALSMSQNDYLYSKNKIGIFGNQSRTISLWFKPNSTPDTSNGGCLASWGVGNKFWGDSTLTYSSLWTQDNTPAFGYVVSGSWEGVTATSFDDTWTNITYVYESDPYTSKFYINGIFNSNLIGWGPIYPDTVDTQLIINARTISTSSGDPLPDTAGGTGINGNYQNVLIYNRALSSSEVAQLVPEPSAVSLLAIGLGVVLRRRRRTV